MLKVGKAELGNSNNYSATHPLRLCIVSPGGEGKLWFSFFPSLCFCRVQAELQDQELIWSWKEHTKGHSEHPGQHWFPCSCLTPHSLWIETEGMWGGHNRGKQESGSCRFLPHTEKAPSPHMGVCPNTEICWDRSGRFSKHWGVV